MIKLPPSSSFDKASIITSLVLLIDYVHRIEKCDKERAKILDRIAEGAANIRPK